MNYSEIKYFDIANGEGVRTSLFVSGCRRGCPGCFNAVAWDFNAGTPFTREVEDQILASLDHPFCDGLTLLGGEPMEPENQRGLVDFVERVRAAFPRGGAQAAAGDAVGAPEGEADGPAKTIWCFTGDTLDELMPGGKHHTEVTDRLLACLDILVDGPYVAAQHDITLRFRGSANQRLIDLNATRAAAAAAGCSLAEAVSLWRDDPVFSTHTM